MKRAVRAEFPGSRSFGLLVLGFFADLALAGGLVPGYFNPTLTWRGYVAYDLTKYGRLVFVPLCLWAGAWLVHKMLVALGGVALLHGTRRRGAVWLGTGAGVLGTRMGIQCENSVVIRVRELPVPANIALGRTSIRIESGGRRIERVVRFRPRPDDLDGLAAWLFEGGVSTKVVWLADRDRPAVSQPPAAGS